jgi:CheY-like chemotaxis protein
MDLEMPIIDGFQMTRYIRDLEKHQSILNQKFKPSFIIGCSAHGI